MTEILEAGPRAPGPNAPGPSAPGARRWLVPAVFLAVVALIVGVVIWAPWGESTSIAGVRSRPDPVWKVSLENAYYLSSTDRTGVFQVDNYDADSTDTDQDTSWSTKQLSLRNGSPVWSVNVAGVDIYGNIGRDRVWGEKYESGNDTSGDSSTDTLYVIDTQSGKVVWSKLMPSTYAALAGDVFVIQTSDTTGLAAWSVADGRELWSRSSGTLLGADPDSGDLFVGDGDTLSVLDARTQTTRAKATLPGSVDSIYFPDEADASQPMILAYSGEQVLAYTPDSLHQLWSTSKEITYFEGADDGVAVVNITPDSFAGIDLRSGRQLWTQTVPGDFSSVFLDVSQGQVLADGYGSNGGDTYVALDLHSGKQLWTATTDGGRSALADGVVYLAQKIYDDDAYVEARDARTGTQLWTMTGTGEVHSLLAVEHGLLVSNEDGIELLR